MAFLTTSTITLSCLATAARQADSWWLGHVKSDDVVIADIGGQALDIFLHGQESAHKSWIVKTFTHTSIPINPCVLRLGDIRLWVIRLGDIRLRDGEGQDEWHRRMCLKWKAVKRRVHPSWLNISGTSVCAKHLCHPSRRHPSRGHPSQGPPSAPSVSGPSVSATSVSGHPSQGHPSNSDQVNRRESFWAGPFN